MVNGVGMISEYLALRVFVSECAYMLGVCVCLSMLQYNGLLYHYKCSYIVTFPLLMLLGTHIPAINGIIYLRYHYECYYTLTLP